MKLGLTFLAATLVSLASAQANGVWNFKLRATTYRYASPNLSGYVDLDAAGAAGFGRSPPSYTGFVSTMNSPNDSYYPVGEIKKVENDVPGWLKPTDTTNLYDFHYGVKPDDVGILFDEFAITVLNCGGQCGGLQLVYGSGSNVKWLAYADANVPSGWKIQYWNGAGNPPAGGHPVWLWRESA
ncbi:hypothetical protein FN846DRAFT_903551 [Sphaerosporella brunnea]|uniref:Uncharacterized protein n=1 Tax=Sphaerosporella brunnea TaxID=1250544 RepID=A0A5J5F6T4_9PEZI|nr:hypothetical protein FN846DRAFT_903551 [Sphaerosporella brunnea]